MVKAKTEHDLHYPQEEYLFLHVISSLLGLFILIYCSVVFIYAPGRTAAKYGTVIDDPDIAINLTGSNSYLLVLLDNGGLVEVHKPDWFDISRNRTVILQERISIFSGVKRYSFYKADGDPHQESAMGFIIETRETWSTGLDQRFAAIPVNHGTGIMVYWSDGMMDLRSHPTA